MSKVIIATVKQDLTRAYALFEKVLDFSVLAGICFSIVDDGTGCDKIVPDFGLKGMKEKINSIGGNIEFSSLPGNGFSVKAYIPVEVINYD